MRRWPFVVVIALAACSGSRGASTKSENPAHAPGPDAGVEPARPAEAPTFVRLDDLKGGSDARLAEIRTRIAQDYRGLAFCYEKQVSTTGDKQLAGTIELEVVIAPDGRVSSSVGRGLPFVDQCVAMAVSAMQFPPNKAGDALHVRLIAGPHAGADAAAAPGAGSGSSVRE